MKAIISSTYDPKYLYFIPICVWAWNKLNVDVICFLPYLETVSESKKIDLITDTLSGNGLKIQYAGFSTPEHKKATYCQISRLYAASLDLPDEEVLLLGDSDMLVLNNDYLKTPPDNLFEVYGMDLVPSDQMPICYCVGHVKTWREHFTKGRTYQQCLDDELEKEVGNVDTRGNLWSRDQELLAQGIYGSFIGHKRGYGANGYANLRYDRDDAYLLDRLSPDTLDFHMPRPGYEEKNFEIILKVLQYHYPNENFQWLIDYTNHFKQLLILE